MAKVSGRSTQSNIIILLSLVLLVVVTPFIANFISNNTQNSQNLAAPKETTSSISLATPAPYSIGQSITFNTNYPSSIKNPRIEVDCYIDGNLVYGEGGAVSDQFQLGGGSSIWLYDKPTQAATCHATLFYFGFHAGKQTYNPLAKTPDFQASGRQ